MLKKKMLGLLAALCVMALMLPPAADRLRVVMALGGVWEGDVATGFAGGGPGTSAGTAWEIATPAQLAYLAQLASASDTGPHQGKYFKLTADIVLNDTSTLDSWGTTPPKNSWAPIGQAKQSAPNAKSNFFRGKFDGAGHTVSGLYIKGDLLQMGLFGGLSSEGEIKNVILRQSYIEGTVTLSDGYAGVGGIVAAVNNGTVEGCGVEKTVTVKGVNNLGGVVGRTITADQNVAIKRCYNRASVTGSGEGVGGVLGVARTTTGNGKTGVTIENCYNTGSVSGNKSVGGLVGFPVGPTKLTACYSLSALIRATADTSAGAIYGSSTATPNVDKCHSYTDSTGVNAAGAYNGATPTLAAFAAGGTVTGLLNGTGSVWTQGDKRPRLGFEPAPDDDEFSGKVWDGGRASAFAGGNGSEASPWEISTPAQLAYLAALAGSLSTKSDHDGKYFKLTADIVLNDTSNLANWGTTRPDNAWTPIGQAVGDPDPLFFRGYFDGNGHKVSGLYIKGDLNQLGLFGGLSSGRSIKNVILLESYIEDTKTTEGNYAGTGGIVGAVNSGTVEGCGVEKTVTVKGYRNVGGVVGKTVYANAAVAIKRCYNRASVTGSGQGVGGILGTARTTTTGLTIENCYNTGAVSAGVQWAGGIVGGIPQTSTKTTITACYSLSALIQAGSAYSGAIYGYKTTDLPLPTVSVVNCYGYTESTGVKGSSWGYNGTTPIPPTPPTIADFADGTVTGLLGGVNVWTQGIKRPLLGFEPTQDDDELSGKIWGGGAATGFAAGKGSSGDPFQIATAGQLAYLAYLASNGTPIRELQEGKYFKLTADIALNDTSNLASWGTTAPANAWKPIGQAMDPNAYFFRGHFDGNRHTVSGLYINDINGDLNQLGLFGGLSSDGSIKNVTLLESYIEGAKPGDEVYAGVGGIVGGVFSGTVEGCGVEETVTVKGVNNVGGVVGKTVAVEQTVVIKSCYNRASVTGSVRIQGVPEQGQGVGGILGAARTTGSSGLTIENCYNIGAVSGYQWAGGLVGRSTGATKLTACYSLSALIQSTGNASAGAICGFGTITSVARCYSYTESTGPYPAAGNNGDKRTTAAFADNTVTALLNDVQDPSPFHQGAAFPLLRWEESDITISVDVACGTMEFTYMTDPGIWNPNNHAYEGAWVCDADANKITVTNNSNVAVGVSFAYTPRSNHIGGSGIFEDEIGAVLANPQTIAGGAAPQSLDAYLVLSGSIDRGNSIPIGSVTVTVALTY